ncbi:spore coat protein YlbD [Sporolactobacillus sp. Y61]|uniref:Spore coat protein YlbD n=1 Tax=Sporolactobacillus sp. Y61 TaxID=3160863 RepID=A0AAU8ICI9_9BACL
MTEDRTNDAKKRFKAFLRRNPKIITYVREHDKRWSEVFDDWVIFGESHEIWEKYGGRSNQSDQSDQKKETGAQLSWHKIMEKVDHIDTRQWQERLNTLNGAITGIQTLIGQFRQETKTDSQGQGQSGQDRSLEDGRRPPFYFRRD